MKRKDKFWKVAFQNVPLEVFLGAFLNPVVTRSRTVIARLNPFQHQRVMHFGNNPMSDLMRRRWRWQA